MSVTRETPCTRCGGTPASQYTFHYGRRSAAPTFGPQMTHATPTYVRRTQAVTYHFTIGGIESTPLCDGCVRHARTSQAFRTFVREVVGFPLFIVAGLAGILWAAANAMQGNWPLAVLLGVGVVAAYGIGFAIVYGLTKVEETAERVAIELRRETLKGRGWTEFWTTAEFAKLH